MPLPGHVERAQDGIVTRIFVYVNVARGATFLILPPAKDQIMTQPENDPTTLSIDAQVAWLMQGTNYGDEETKRQMTRELRERLGESQRTDKALRVYCGYDPTKPDLHLGHTITMRKLRQFQDLGHDVTFLIGSYTSLVGDPSDKNKARPVMTEAEVAENARTYVEQALHDPGPQ